MIRALVLATVCCALASPLAAQPLDGDGRLVTVPYRQGETIPLRTAVGNGLTIIFAPGEQILGFETADPSAFELALSGSADSLLVRTLKQPTSPQLTLRTQLRAYVFSLDVGSPQMANYVVRFDFGPKSGPGDSKAPPVAGRYRLSGTRALRPTRIDDDGEHTYLEWAPDQLLPAVFAVNDLGGEEMVDGYMREGVFTIDRVNRVLVFRIDRKSAKAERLAK